MTIERVTFAYTGGSSDCQPKIQTIDGTAGRNDNVQACSFEIGDFERVLDFDIIPPSPPDTLLRLGESDTYFPFRYFCLRGCFLFYFLEEDVQQSEGDGAMYVGKPRGVIPLDRTRIDFPEGGRRVFQKHANSNASKGYEFVIVHTPKKDSNDAKRPDKYLVADTSSQREEWKLALSSRSGGILKDTILRPGGGHVSLSTSSQRTLHLAPTLSSSSSFRGTDTLDDRRKLNRAGTMNITSQRGKLRRSPPNPFDDPTCQRYSIYKLPPFFVASCNS
eukprot:CAMPEP_0172421210 /NCGR_PEP_ID=MMETSP1064-20121228/7476_1 /TAXON_ID=202472 /ORGANISM="Aulacoseira subarctica , Strain CCAP 1002/5" /LENGTH=275 /DNA_ID=CAMNT_0013161497 /DNA_START=39 /DNA_END=866 /DNA_ORIENTATION=+